MVKTMKLKVKSIFVKTKSYKSLMEQLTKDNLEDIQVCAEIMKSEHIQVLHNNIDEIEMPNGNTVLLNVLTVTYDGYLISEGEYEALEKEVIEQIKDLIKTIAEENKIVYSFID